MGESQQMRKKLKDLFSKRNAAMLIGAIILIVIYILLQNFSDVRKYVGKVIGYFSPVIIGLVIAYLLNPLVEFFGNVCFKKIKKRSLANGLAVFVVVILVLVILVSLIAFIIPEIIQSVETIVTNMDNYMNTFKDFLKGVTEKVPIIDIDIDKLIGDWSDIFQTAVKWVNDNSQSIINASISVAGAVMNAILGFMIAVYILIDKQRLMNSVKRLFTAVTKEEKYEKRKQRLDHVNHIMSKYISCEIIDALIIFVSNYIFMIIFDMPYQLLISVIVGVTNLIPNFGPFIGGIPSFLLILIINPMDAVIFGIWTIGLQFIDGNAIKPLLFGDALGLPSAWVLISIVVGGRMFGIAGMVLGAPVATIIFYAIDEYLTKRENEKKAVAPDAEITGEAALPSGIDVDTESVQVDNEAVSYNAEAQEIVVLSDTEAENISDVINSNEEKAGNSASDDALPDSSENIKHKKAKFSKKFGKSGNKTKRANK